LKLLKGSHTSGSGPNNKQYQGNILFLEDVTKGVVEILGSELDIDPLFFASHIHGPDFTIQSARPSTVILPSELAKQSFLSLQFQKALVFGREAAAFGKMFTDGNIPRRMRLLPAEKKTANRIGLAQQSCSVFLAKPERNGWLGTVQRRASIKRSQI
jgi:hypothetical protein